MNVHVLDMFLDGALEELRARLSPGVSLSTGPEPARPDKLEILVGESITRRRLTASRGLRAVILPITGVPRELRELMLEFPQIPLHNSHWTALPTAEGALTLLLSAAKFILPADRALRNGDWRMRYAPSPSILLQGRTVLLLGYGRIGQHIARMCHAFGMQVLAARRNPGRPAPQDLPTKVFAVADLHHALSLASILIITVPLTEETRGLIGAKELGLLQKPSFLVNVGRGPVVEEAALYQALRTGVLHAAGLDVWYNYPTDEASRAHTAPSRFPFHELQNVVMSPHRVDLVEENERRMAAELAETLNAAFRGEPIPNRVDVEAGY